MFLCRLCVVTKSCGLLTSSEVLRSGTHCDFVKSHFIAWLKMYDTAHIREAVKKGYFTVRLTVRGEGGISHLGPDLSNCENFYLFFPLNFDSLIPKTHFISL